MKKSIKQTEWRATDGWNFLNPTQLKEAKKIMRRTRKDWFFEVQKNIAAIATHLNYDPVNLSRKQHDIYIDEGSMLRCRTCDNRSLDIIVTALQLSIYLKIIRLQISVSEEFANPPITKS